MKSSTLKNLPFLFIIGISYILRVSEAWSSSRIFDNNNRHQTDNIGINRRDALTKSIIGSAATTMAVIGITGISPTMPAYAYEPDPDPLKESLYLLCRVQEATCLQERYIQKKLPPIQKMKLTLRLVDKSYRILDQVNYVSKYIPDENLVLATQLGNEAASSLQDAIDFVMNYNVKDVSNMTYEQRDYLIDALTTTREKIFEFVDLLPDQSKLLAARQRVENENKLNRDEFDPDLTTDAGIYNPVVLPWIDRQKKA